jgi:hypothetical protein
VPVVARSFGEGLDLELVWPDAVGTDDFVPRDEGTSREAAPPEAPASDGPAQALASSQGPVPDLVSGRLGGELPASEGDDAVVAAALEALAGAVERLARKVGDLEAAVAALRRDLAVAWTNGVDGRAGDDEPVATGNGTVSAPAAGRETSSRRGRRFRP